MPSDLRCVATSSMAIDCTWSQPSTEIVDHYLFSWHYTGPCDEDAQSFLLEGSVRNQRLQDLQEGGNYAVSLFGLNDIGQGPTAMTLVSTSSAGTYIHTCINSHRSNFVFNKCIQPHPVLLNQ